jgi:hypothetical protein
MQRRPLNRWLTALSNIVNNLNLSDMETGYTAFRRSALEGIAIRENRFGKDNGPQPLGPIGALLDSFQPLHLGPAANDRSLPSQPPKEPAIS